MVSLKDDGDNSFSSCLHLISPAGLKLQPTTTTQGRRNWGTGGHCVLKLDFMQTFTGIEVAENEIEI